MAASGNVRYSQIRSGDRSGNGTKIATVTGTLTTGKQLEFDASGNIKASSTDVGGGSGGGLVLLSTQAASSSASLDFTSVLSATYRDYVIVVSDMLPATDGAKIGIRYSTNNGSSYIATNYSWSAYATTWNGAGANGSTSDTAGYFTSNQDSATGSTPFSGTFYLCNPRGTTNYTTVYGTGFGITSTASTINFTVYVLNNSTTSAVDAFQILCSSGNIASGTVSLYGLAIT